MSEKNELPRPSKADYEKKSAFDKAMSKGELVDYNEYMDLFNRFDWSAEVFESNGKYGLKNAVGEIIVAPDYEDFMMLSSSDLQTGDWVVAQDKGKWGVLEVDGNGNWMIEPEYDYIGYPNPITHVRKNEKWGVLDINKNEFIIPLECDKVHADMGFMFTNGIAIYEKDGKVGVIIEDGRFTSPIFEDVDEENGFVKVKHKGEWGYINQEGEFTTSEDEEEYWCYDE
jgi:hypothetical protein